jgi:hypothetical protein
MLPQAGLPGGQLLGLLLGEVLDWLLNEGCELRWFVEKESLHGLREVRKQMPAVGDLLRLRCSLPGSLRIRATAISADDLHSCGGLEPLFQ